MSLLFSMRELEWVFPGKFCFLGGCGTVYILSQSVFPSPASTARHCWGVKGKDNENRKCHLSISLHCKWNVRGG